MFFSPFRSCQPADFGYNYDSKRHNMLITAQLYQDPSGDEFLCELAATLSKAKACMYLLNFLKQRQRCQPVTLASGHTPLHLLRPCFLYLANHPEVYLQVIRFLQCPLVVQLNLSLGHSCSLDVTTRREFRHSLTRYLFGWDLLLQLRLRLAIADFLLRASADECFSV